MIKIAFIEDNHAYRKSLQASIRLQPDIQVLLAVDSIEAFFKRINDRIHLDVIFLDIDLPGQSGLEGLPTIKKRFDKSEIIMLTGIEQEKTLLKAFHNGATGYLVKNFTAVQLPKFIKVLQAGGALISPSMARNLITHFQPKHKDFDLLTAQELKILQLISDGYTYDEVAYFLNISTHGVKYHIKKIYKKLGVSKKIEAINIYKHAKTAYV
ncbi:MAG: response regulator transcription factor [Bacteroidota bacterium]